MKYNGLKARDKYDEIVDYLANRQQVVRYPDRWAKRTRESPYLTNLDWDGAFELNELKEKEMKEQEKERAIRQMTDDRSAPQGRLDARLDDQARDQPGPPPPGPSSASGQGPIPRRFAPSGQGPLSPSAGGGHPPSGPSSSGGYPPSAG